MRNLIRRFVEVGVPGYHIEDQRPGHQEVRPPGRQGAGARGRADQAPQRRALPARRHGGAGHHRRPHRRRGGQPPRRPRRRARPAVHPRRDQPRAAVLQGLLPGADAALPRARASSELNGHLLYAISRRGVRAPPTPGSSAPAWRAIADDGAAALRQAAASSASTPIFDEVDVALRRAPGRPRPASRPTARRWPTCSSSAASEGEALDDERRASGGASPSRASLYAAREKAQVARRPRHLGLRAAPRPRRATTRSAAASTYAIAKSLAAAPFADLLWMETKTADLDDARAVRRGDPRRLPGQDAGLQPVAVVQLGHDRHERRRDAALPRGARQDGLRLQLHHLRRPPDRRRRRRGVRHRAQAGRHARAGPAAAEDPAGRVAVPDAADAGRRPARSTPR